MLLPGKSHGRRSLEGCSPWGHWGSDMTERLHFSLSCIGEGSGNPHQCSCLENPMDGGAWWATVHRVAKSWTQLSDFTHSLCCVKLWVTEAVFLVPKWNFLLQRSQIWHHSHKLSLWFLRFPKHQPIREWCLSRSHTLHPSLLQLSYKSSSLRAMSKWGRLFSRSCLFSLSVALKNVLSFITTQCQ